jgi:Fic family protein
MENDPVAGEIQKINLLIRRLENLAARIEDSQKQCNRMFDELKSENDSILSELKLHIHRSIAAAERRGFDLIPEIPIEDKKLKAAWIALFQHHNGATADEIAAGLHRHRTTVSTYLNTLVLMNYVSKERIGHEIYYKAVINEDNRNS